MYEVHIVCLLTLVINDVATENVQWFKLLSEESCEVSVSIFEEFYLFKHLAMSFINDFLS